MSSKVFYPLSFALGPQSKNEEARNKTSATPVKHSSHGGGVSRMAMTSHDSIIHLQKTIGNQAVQRLLRSKARDDAMMTGIQTKLKISQPGDTYEQEADRVAEHIMKMSDLGHVDLTVSREEERIDRKCSKCEMKKEERNEHENKLDTSQKLSTKPNPNHQTNNEVPNEINSVSGGSLLDNDTRELMEPRFGYDFSDVRIHADERASKSASSVNALAYTIGNNIVFGDGRFQPSTSEGRSLLAHELTHVVQQRNIFGLMSRQEVSSNKVQDKKINTQGYLNAEFSFTNASYIQVARKPGDQSNDKESPDDPMAGTLVTGIVIDLARGRVGFKVGGMKGLILGKVSTDLKPGKYTVKTDVANKKWIFEPSQVKSGLRFSVDLEGADPWTLRYPDVLSVIVGHSANKKGGGPESEADLVRLFDEMAEYPDIPPSRPDINPDAFDSVQYNPFYRTEKGGLSKWLKLTYPDGKEVDIHLDSIKDEKVTPRLWEAKKDAYLIMEEYNFEYMVGLFPVLFFIITINPFVAPTTGGGGSFRATRRLVSGSSPPGKSPATPKEPIETPPGKSPATPKEPIETPLLPLRGTRQKPTLDWTLAPSDEAGMGHLDWRHAPWSRVGNTSKFTQNAWNRLRTLVDETVEKGTIGIFKPDKAGPQAGVTYQHKFTEPIGVNAKGNKQLYNMRVVVDANNHVTTTFPF